MDSEHWILAYVNVTFLDLKEAITTKTSNVQTNDERFDESIQTANNWKEDSFQTTYVKSMRMS